MGGVLRTRAAATNFAAGTARLYVTGDSDTGFYFAGRFGGTKRAQRGYVAALDPEILIGADAVTKHMPPVPPANHSHKGTGDSDNESLTDGSLKHSERQNIAEQPANIKQNTTSKGYSHGRRMK
jgi:hypothetical protein